MTGRCFDKVFTISLINTPGKKLRIEHDGKELVAHFTNSLTIPQRQPTGFYLA